MAADSQIYLHLPAGVTREQVLARLSEPLRPHTTVVRTPDDGLAVKYRSASAHRNGALYEAGLLVATMLLPLPLAEISVYGAFLQHGEFPAHAALLSAIAVMPARHIAFVLTDPDHQMFICAVCAGEYNDDVDVLPLLADIAEKFQR